MSGGEFIRAIEAELRAATEELRAELAEFDRQMEEFFAELAAWEPKGLRPFLEAEGAE